MSPLPAFLYIQSECMKCSYVSALSAVSWKHGEYIFHSAEHISSLGSEVFPPLLLLFIYIYSETDVTMTLAHTP